MVGTKYSQLLPKILPLFCNQLNTLLQDALKVAHSISANVVNRLYLHRDGPLCATD